MLFVLTHWSCSFGSSIHNSRIKDTFRHDLIAVIRQQAAIITTAVAIVACRASLLDHAHQYAVLFTIDKYSTHFLHIPGLLSLTPDSIARTAEEMCVTCLTCALQSLLVHEGHHQHLSRGIILDHGRNQS